MKYFTVRNADIDIGVDAEDYLAKDVYETTETYDIGLLDAAGNKVMAAKKKNPIGFIHFKEK